MNADKRRFDEVLLMESPEGFKHTELTEKIISTFYDVYNELGYGFLESVYQRAMTIALQDASLKVASEMPISVWFRSQPVGEFRADLVVDDLVLLELKSARTLESVHESQTLNYLRATSLEVALLLNFGPRPQVRRLAFANERKKISVNLRSSAAKGFA
jgi:GxxExxY protein